MEKINVSDQMVEYEFIWYIPFEDWSFDDIVYTHVGSIVTVSFSLYVFKHYTYIYIWWSIEEKKRKRDEASMKRIITSFGDFLYLSFSVSSRIQIICVWMTRVLHHLSDIKMRHVAPVSRSRMNGQLDVTGARRHTHLYIWWMMESKMTV